MKYLSIGLIVSGLLFFSFLLIRVLKPGWEKRQKEKDKKRFYSNLKYGTRRRKIRKKSGFQRIISFNFKTSLRKKKSFMTFLIIYYFILGKTKKYSVKKSEKIETEKQPSLKIDFNTEQKIDKEKRKDISKPENEDDIRFISKPEEMSKFVGQGGADVSNPKKSVSVIQTKPKTNSSKNLPEPNKEDQLHVKYIGYNPINIFAQTEPFNYPYVIMPKTNSVIKFPRKGRSGRKGYKEEEFKKYIEKYFKSDFQVFDDRFIVVKNNSNPYEPDFTLINERNGINIFLDVEIDEPYEGLNDISKRKSTHFRQSDNNRNNAFKNRGWIVIRFAEIQVHKEPNSCCRFIADVLVSINSKFIIPDRLTNCQKVKPINQWTKEQAENWSIEKYREKYLGIDIFGSILPDAELSGIEETYLGKEIEEQVEDDIFININTVANTTNTKLEKIYSAINSNKYLSFTINNERTIVKPIQVLENELVAFCYVKNRKRNFLIYGIDNVEIKETYFTLRVAGPTIGLDQITNAINTAITYHKLIRMKYTRSSWTNMFVDKETGELLIDKIEAEESIRTINDVQLSINALAQEQIEAYSLNNNYITAYCNKREEQRTFRFDRIGEIEILNL